MEIFNKILSFVKTFISYFIFYLKFPNMFLRKFLYILSLNIYIGSIISGIIICDLSIINSIHEVCYHIGLWTFIFNLFLTFLVFFIIYLVNVFLYPYTIIIEICAVYAFFSVNYEIFSTCSLKTIIMNIYPYLIVSIFVSYIYLRHRKTIYYKNM
jgi:hypothetical protein